ncbi:hypothetical protein L7F22_050690 [Adiantum nelumboides]|nr:hypothetical protein [Adiantum nelumboides]
MPEFQSPEEEEQPRLVPGALDIREQLEQEVEEMLEGPAKEYLLYEKKVMESAALAFLQLDDQIKDFGNDFLPLPLMRHEAILRKEKLRPTVPRNEEGGYEGIPLTFEEAQILIEDHPRWKNKWPRSPVRVGLAIEKLQHIKDYLQDHMDMLKLTRQNVCQAQDRYKNYADEKRQQVIFKEGDYVFLRVPKHSDSLKSGPTPKLSPRFCGPYVFLHVPKHSDRLKTGPTPKFLPRFCGAFKILRYQEKKTLDDPVSQELVKVYEARIVVDATPQVATAISAIANEQAKVLYVKQPYTDILKHLKSQWEFHKLPARPSLGVTEGHPTRANWDEKEQFKDLLEGILAIAGGSSPSQYVFLIFLNGEKYAQLQLAFQELSKFVHKTIIGALHFSQDPCFLGAIEYFTILVFLSKGEKFEGLPNTLSPGAQATTIDPTSLLNTDYDVVANMSNMEFLNLKKKLLIQQCVQRYCVEDQRLLDIFNGGLISQIGLEKRRKMICLVENVDERKKLAASLIHFAESNEDIQKWAGLECEQPIQQVLEKAATSRSRAPRTQPLATIFLAREASMR